LLRVLLLRSSLPADTWRDRLQLRGPALVLPADAEAPGAARFLGATCAGAAARLLGVLSREALERALGEELQGLSGPDLRESLDRALAAWEHMSPSAGCVREGEEIALASLAAPDWIDVPSEHGPASEPAVLVPASSVQVRTGLWRTMRPVIDSELCHRCSWICSTYCPDGAILVDEERRPSIDYDHCKGCLVCVAVCPARHPGLSEQESAVAEAAAPGRRRRRRYG
jgi:pyruvate ferredoxin oxidoreductase gamma subunit